MAEKLTVQSEFDDNHGDTFEMVWNFNAGEISPFVNITKLGNFDKFAKKLTVQSEFDDNHGDTFGMLWNFNAGGILPYLSILPN